MRNKKKYIYPVIILFLCIFYHAGYSQKITRNISEKLIAKVDMKKMVDPSFSISQNLRRIAYRIKSGSKQRVVIDGREQLLYDSVSSVIFNPDGNSFAYYGRSGSKWFIIRNGKEVVRTSSQITSILFHPRAGSILYIIIERNKSYLVANGVKSQPYDYISENSLAFAPDRNKIAFLAQKGTRQMIVYAGKEGTGFNEVGFPILSAAGNRMGYWARRGENWYVVIDGKESGPYNAVHELVFSNDGKHSAYHAVKGGKHIAVRDGKESEKYIMVHSLTFNPSGKNLAYGIESSIKNKEGFNHYAVINGKMLPCYETVVEGTLTWSHDGTKLAYEAEWHDEFFAIVGGKEGKRYGDVIQVTMTYSPDDRHFAYGADEGVNRKINRDGKESINYQDIYALKYSPDSRHLAYSVKLNNKDLVVIDEQKGRSYNSLMSQGEIVFDAANKLHYMAMKGNGIYLVEESW